MHGYGKIKVAGAVLACVAGLSAAPASANRCGNSFAVDQAITLSKVARQCNVRLSELIEANPGVNPSHVRPGQHLAVPDERRRDRVAARTAPEREVAAVRSANDDNRVTNAHPYVVSSYEPRITDDDGLRRDYPVQTALSDRNVYEVDEYWRDNDIAVHRVRLRKSRFDDAPSWLRPEPVSGGHYSSSDRLSFQQRSALRLANAGNSASRFAQGSGPGVRQVGGLIECPVLRNSAGVKIHAVSQVIATPGATFVEIFERPNGAYDCTLFNAASYRGAASYQGPSAPGDNANVPAAKFTAHSAIPAYRAAAPYPGFRPPSAPPEWLAQSTDVNFALQGDVIAVDDGCLILRTSANDLWRLAAAPPSGDLLGKRVTVWGAPANAGTCSGGPAMVVSHAVYAEPVGLGKN